MSSQDSIGTDRHDSKNNHLKIVRCVAHMWNIVIKLEKIRLTWVRISDCSIKGRDRIFHLSSTHQLTKGSTEHWCADWTAPAFTFQRRFRSSSKIRTVWSRKITSVLVFLYFLLISQTKISHDFPPLENHSSHPKSQCDNQQPPIVYFLWFCGRLQGSNPHATRLLVHWLQTRSGHQWPSDWRLQPGFDGEMLRKLHGKRRRLATFLYGFAWVLMDLCGFI